LYHPEGGHFVTSDIMQMRVDEFVSMENILLPTKFEIIPGERPGDATLVLEPCFYGYGTTVGNALRRVLLSSLPGAAVTAVKIRGVQHEFSTIPNVKEDVLEIILNLKLLRLRLHSDEPVKLQLSVKGEKKVKAGDFAKNSNVEIVNTDLHIATLTDKKAEFEMEITVERGRGYVPTEERRERPNEIGVIMIDALFSPIRNVGYRVENARVGEITNYDRLVMNIETDGTVTPREAITEAAKVLLNYFSLLLGEKEVLPAATDESAAEEGTEETLPEETEEVTEIPVETEEVREEGTDDEKQKRGRKPGTKKTTKKK